MKGIIKEESHRHLEFDPATGEVTGESLDLMQSRIRVQVPEEHFIKIYYDTFLASLGENSSTMSSFLVALGKRMTYSSEGQCVILIKEVKEDIAKELGISASRVTHLLTEATKKGLLIRKGSSRSATYLVSPFIMAKGDWDTTQGLQITYNKALESLDIKAPRPKAWDKIAKKAQRLEHDTEEPEHPQITIGEVNNE